LKQPLRKIARTAKIRIQTATNIITLPYNQGKLVGQSIKAYNKVKPILNHVEKCPRCKPIFSLIQNCQTIKDLPNGSFKEANQHILEHKECRDALEQILACPIYKEKHKL
jgi:hypothetical protein